MKISLPSEASQHLKERAEGRQSPWPNYFPSTFGGLWLFLSSAGKYVAKQNRKDAKVGKKTKDTKRFIFFLVSCLVFLNFCLSFRSFAQTFLLFLYFSYLYLCLHLVTIHIFQDTKDHTNDGGNGNWFH